MATQPDHCRTWTASLVGVLLAIVASLAGASRPARAEFTSELVKAFEAPGKNPDVQVVGSDGAVYGTTSGGGPADRGTIFRIDSAGNFTTLVSLPGTPNYIPSGGLVVGNDGSIYGNHWTGGSGSHDTVFKIGIALEIVTRVASRCCTRRAFWTCWTC